MSQAYQLPSNAVWFITGCSSGMGEALASVIAKTSNRVVATARKVSALSSLPDSENVLKLPLDVTSTTAIKSVIGTALEKFGRIDVFVNNAGYGMSGDFEGIPDQEARRQMDTNFWGAVDVTREALRVLREENPKTGQNGGVIAQITSMGGREGFPGQAFYHASKFALEGLTEGVAKEVDPKWNIHFTLIEPGGVKTDYTGRSMVYTERHPAYADPALGTNQLMAYMSQPGAMDNFGDPVRVAELMYSVIKDGVKGANGGKGGIPFRLPIGSDSWGMQKLNAEKTLKEFDVLEPVSCSVAGKEQLASIEFLK